MLEICEQGKLKTGLERPTLLYMLEVYVQGEFEEMVNSCAANEVILQALYLADRDSKLKFRTCALL